MVGRIMETEACVAEGAAWLRAREAAFRGGAGPDGAAAVAAKGGRLRGAA